VGASVANPQLENGYLQISLEFWDAVCRLRIPGEARQVYDFILRKTWGWKKKSDQIPLSQIALGTGLKKAKVIRARDKLLAMKLVSIAQKGNGSSTIYTVNKDFDSWKPFPKKRTFPKKGIIIPLLGNKTFPEKVPSINTTKDTLQKKSLGSSNQGSRVGEFKDLFRQKHLQKFGQEYIFNHGKDGGLIKAALNIHSFEQLNRCLDIFFETKDSFIEKAGRTVGVFFSQLNRIIQGALSPPGPDHNTLATLRDTLGGVL
jgi:phage replication O-like protein O